MEIIMMELPLKVDFTGKVVVITGASGVLCGAMARAFALRRISVMTVHTCTFFLFIYVLSLSVTQV